MLTDLYLIRHGQPAYNPAIAYNVPPGPELSERGRAEAAEATTFLSDKGITHLLASPFARATQTAEVLVERLGLAATFTSVVQEHGPSESFEQVRARIADLLAALHDSPHTRVAVVAHGSPIRAALLELSRDKIDLSRHVYQGGNPAPTCGIWHIQFIDAYTRRFELVFRPS
ncbi:MAG: histidine phosphatase family protein [Chloroflexales bacterium]|nr:histidine phosphatase family protein [Chloroflexales bacterium]